MPKAKTAAEKRLDLQRQIDEMDLATLGIVLDIFARPEVVQAVTDLRALGDETDAGARHRSPGADLNALVANGLLPFVNIPAIATSMRQALEQRLGLAVSPDPAALAPLPPTE